MKVLTPVHRQGGERESERWWEGKKVRIRLDRDVGSGRTPALPQPQWPVAVRTAPRCCLTDS